MAKRRKKTDFTEQRERIREVRELVERRRKLLREQREAEEAGRPARAATAAPYSCRMSVSAAAPEVEHAPDQLALGAFAGAILIGGSNFVAVRYSNRELDPLWGAGLRFALAAVVFGVLVAALRLPLPRGRVLALVVTYGLVGFAGAYGCLYWAMKEVPAGIAAVVLAVGPLLTLLLAVAHRMERLNGRAVAGALIAVAGSAVIFFQRELGRLRLAVVRAAGDRSDRRLRVGDRVEARRAAEPGGDELHRHERGRRRVAGGVGAGGRDASPCPRPARRRSRSSTSSPPRSACS